MLPFRLIMEEELGAVGGVGATSVNDDEDRVLYLDEATLKRMMPVEEKEWIKGRVAVLAEE